MEHQDMEYYLFNINKKLKYKHKALFHLVLGGFFMWILAIFRLLSIFLIVWLICLINVLRNLSKSTKNFDYRKK